MLKPRFEGCIPSLDTCELLSARKSCAALLTLSLAACGDSTVSSNTYSQMTGIMTLTQGLTGAAEAGPESGTMIPTDTSYLPTSNSDGATDSATSGDFSTTMGTEITNVTTTPLSDSGQDSVCGNGIKDSGEECDDGNLNDKDECTQECMYPLSPCATQHAESSLKKAPVDVIVAIDNSGSMTPRIKNVQDNINQNFAKILDAEGLDYQVVIVSEHGSYSLNQSVCIESPLSGIPQGGCANPPIQPVDKPPIFRHHNHPVESNDMWSVLSNQYNSPDKNGKSGWGSTLRPNAFKNIVAVTDDNIYGKTSDGFDNELLILDPTQFGVLVQRRYKYFSIIGMPKNGGKPYLPNEPINYQKCDNVPNAGQIHQELSILTDGARYSICEADYSPIFKDIAQSIVTGTPIDCEFDVPMPPNNQTINFSTVELVYQQGGLPIPFEQVPTFNDCFDDNDFYIKDEKIILCPQACDAIQKDSTAKIDIDYSCIPDAG